MKHVDATLDRKEPSKMTFGTHCNEPNRTQTTTVEHEELDLSHIVRKKSRPPKVKSESAVGTVPVAETPEAARAHVSVPAFGC